MKTVQTQINPESTHHSLINHENQTFFQQASSNESPLFFRPATIKPKLKIGDPDDKYERQADRVADAVVSSAAPDIQQQSGEEEEEMLQMKCSECEKEDELQMKREPILQRKCMECEEEKNIQMKANNPTGTEITAGDQISHQLKTSRGSGNRLPGHIESEMSRKIGADFNNVNVHTDSNAIQMSRSLGARAFTHGNDIYFNQGEYKPSTNNGKHLLVHELTHVVQQNGGISRKIDLIQCDLVLPPQGSGQQRALSQIDIARAIQFNEQRFTDPYSLKTIRDVIGIAQYPAVSDEAMVRGIARWQADHGIAQDGKAGVVTLLTILEELEAEGQDRDAQLLRADFQGVQANMLDIDSSHCGCVSELQSEIAESQDFINVYQQCGADPSVNTGADVENCVNQHFASQGISLSIAGSTSSSGATTVASQPGTCGPLVEMVSRAHEQVHALHIRELRQQHGSGQAFSQAFNSVQDWVADEVNSRESDIALARYMINVLNNICSLNP